VDTKFGGFHSHFGLDWKELPGDGKFSVFQGRMTWVAAQVVLCEPAMKDEFADNCGWHTHYRRQGIDLERRIPRWTRVLERSDRLRKLAAKP
jgi:hypothetical protein